jgi:hypothetical protein
MEVGQLIGIASPRCRAAKALGRSPCRTNSILNSCIIYFDSTVTAITTGALSCGPLMNSTSAITSLRFGVIAR